MEAEKTVAQPEIEGAAVLPPRRRLAPNVVCMFAEDRPPVVNPPRRGRYPRGVKELRFWDRLRPGVYAYMWTATPTNPNRGIVVRLVEKYDDGDWLIESCGRELQVENGTYLQSAAAKPENLRRCPAP